MPLDAYRLDDALSTAVSNAQELVVVSCMKAKGFDYTPRLDQPGDEMSGIGDDLPPEVGLLDLASAREHGYRSKKTDGSPPMLESGPNPDSSAFTTALLGPIAGPGRVDAGVEAERKRNPGCTDVAFAAVRSPGEADRAAEVRELGVRAVDSTRGDQRVVGVMREWSRCMADHGFQYSTPADAAATAWPRKLGQREISTAVADVQCKHDVGVVERWRSVEAGYQRDLIETGGPLLEQVKRDNRASLERATAILKTGRE